MTVSTFAEGIPLLYADTTGGQFTATLTRCDCCPEHLFWREANNSRVCGECWNPDMPTLTLAEAEEFARRVAHCPRCSKRAGA